jgi:YqaJ-like viral recombinase domain
MGDSINSDEEAAAIIEQVTPTVMRQAAHDARIAMYPFLARGLADSRDRVAWAKARSGRIGASDAAGFSKIESAHLYLRSKLFNPFNGNGYTAHGNDREPHILRAYNVEQNFTLFASAGNDRHVATPDGYKLGSDGTFILVQAKTTLKDLSKIPPTYQRQMWWEQYVTGAERTLFVWETHENGVPVSMEPSSQWFYRDDSKIETLITIADLVLAGMDAAAEFEKEMRSA